MSFLLIEKENVLGWEPGMTHWHKWWFRQKMIQLEHLVQFRISDVNLLHVFHRNHLLCSHWKSSHLSDKMICDSTQSDIKLRRWVWGRKQVQANVFRMPGWGKRASVRNLTSSWGHGLFVPFALSRCVSKNFSPSPTHVWLPNLT